MGIMVYSLLLIMGNAGFISSTVPLSIVDSVFCDSVGPGCRTW